MLLNSHSSGTIALCVISHIRIANVSDIAVPIIFVVPIIVVVAAFVLHALVIFFKSSVN